MSKFFRIVRGTYQQIVNLAARTFGAFSGARMIIVDDDEILAVNQGAYFELPGGAVKFGETLEEAAVRETEEETGIKTEIESIVQLGEFGSHTEVMFKGHLTDSKELKKSWEGEPKWIPLEDAYKEEWRYDRDIKKLVEKSSS